ncbi:MAG: phosphatase PAP2 family protein [Spirochaetales bacterium]|jgi:membrane-associated phospholipid phosphatase|nr:phosphatase PAP2 family protein [Spirochaetales bacterium]
MHTRTKKLILFLTVFCCLPINTFSQNAYSVDAQKDILIGTLSLAAGISPFFIKNEPENTPAALDKNTVNLIDRHLMFSRSKPLDTISDYGGYGLTLLPLMCVIPNIKSSHTLLTYSIMYGEAVLLTYGTVSSLKNAIIRYRPYMYTGGVPAGKEKDYYNSFPSGSTSLAFLGATFFSVTYSREFPESEWRLPLIIGSYALASTVGSLRIASGSHFLTDVVTGAALGSLYGWLVPRLHQKPHAQNYALIPTGNGLIVSLQF